MRADVRVGATKPGDTVREGVPDDVGEMPRVSEGVREREPLPEAELLAEPGAHDWLDDYIFSLAGPIYAGSNEIQRNIIAERMLGLPR